MNRPHHQPLTNMSSSTPPSHATTYISEGENEMNIDQLGDARMHNELPVENEEAVDEKNEDIDSLKNEVIMKNLENERLKSDMEVLQQQLKVCQDTSLENNKISNEVFLMKQQISDLLVEKELLEEENRNTRKTMEESEEKIKYLTKELTTVENLNHQEMEVLVYTKDTEIKEWKRRCEKNELEISDLKEYNRVVNERLNELGSLPSRNTESLDQEFKLQVMQERILEMTANCRVIEEQQVKVLNENEKLCMQKANLEALVRKLNLEKAEFEKQSMEQNEKLTMMMAKNETLAEENRVWQSKVCDGEKFGENCSRQLNASAKRSDNSRTEFHEEKRDLESKLVALSQELHSRSQKLEEAFMKNEEYRSKLQETKIELHHKVTALLVMTSHCGEVEKERENLKSRVRVLEKDLKTMEATTGLLKKEILSRHSLMEQSTEENARKYAQLQQKLTEDASVNDQLRAQVVELSEINGRQSQLLNDFENRLSSLTIEKCESERSLKYRIATLESQEKSVCVSNEGTIENNRQLSKKLQEVVRERDSQIEEKSQIEGNLHEIISENENLLLQLADLEEEFKKSQETNEDLRRELRKVQEELETFFNDPQIELPEGNRNICDLLNALFLKLRSALSEVGNLKEFEKNFRKNLQQVEANNLYLQNEMQKLTSKLSHEIEENYQIKNEMRVKSEENKSLRDQVQNLSTQLKSVCDRVKDTEKLNETIEKKMVEAEANDERLSREVQEWIREHDVKVEEQSRMENGIRSLIHESECLRGQIENLVQKFSLATTEFERSKVERENLEKSLQKTEINNVRLLAEVEELRSKYNEMVEKKDQTNYKAQKLVEESEHFFKEVFNFCEKLERTVNRSKRAIEQKLLDVEANNENLRAELELCTRECEARIQEKIELNDTLQKLFQTNYTLSTLNATLLGRMDSKTKEVDDLKLVSEKTDCTLRETNASFESLSWQIMCQLERQKEENESLKVENERLMRSNTEKLELLKEVETRVTVVAAEMTYLKRHNEELERLHNDLKEQLENQRSKELELRSVNAELDQAVYQLENGKDLLLRQLAEISSKHDFLNSQTESVKRELQLKVEDERRLRVLEPNDIDTSPDNKMRLIDEMEKLLDQNRILRLEVDTLIAQVESFSANNEPRDLIHSESDERVRDVPPENDSMRKGELGTAQRRRSVSPGAESHGLLESLKELQLMDKAETRTFVENLLQEKESLYRKLETLNVKLVEESEHIAVLQRTHTAQLQKQIEINKSLESRLHTYESRDGWKLLKVEEPSNLQNTEVVNVGMMYSNIILDQDSGNPESKTTELNGDGFEKLQRKADDFRERREMLIKAMEDIRNRILSGEDSDVNKLKNDLKIVEDLCQGVILLEGELEDQYRNVSELLDRKCHKVAQKTVERKEPTETSTEDIEVEKTRVENGIPNSATTGESISLVPDTHLLVARRQEDGNSAPKTCERQSTCLAQTEEENDSNLAEVRERALTGITPGEKLQGTAVSYNEMVKNTCHGTSNTANVPKRSGILHSIFVMHGQVNFHPSFTQQNDEVWIWSRFSACFVYFLAIYWLTNFFF